MLISQYHCSPSLPVNMVTLTYQSSDQSRAGDLQQLKQSLHRQGLLPSNA